MFHLFKDPCRMHLQIKCSLLIGSISVCTINDEGLARYLSPSLTCVEMPDPTPYIRMCIERMQSTDNEWVGSLLIQPSEPQLFMGESTGSAKVIV